MVKDFKTVRNVYISPRVEFEELEENELDMLLAGSDNTGDVDGMEDGGGDKTPVEPDAFDFDFSDDFVINDNTENEL
ncbi:MAG: hypothetical protein IKO82_01745 [Prevotella sp.]|nr:hypothetical protein [Prevotella sp.]